MAGYGNRTAPSYDPSDLESEYNTTRLGLIDSHTAYHNPHEKHGSGTTGGAGFGNKRSSLSSSSTSSSSPPSTLRLSSSASATPYSNPGRLGSGSTAGAGYGNKTGHMGATGAHPVLGKAVEKVGGVVGSQRVVRMGKGMMREKEGFEADEKEEGVGERMAN